MNAATRFSPPSIRQRGQVAKAMDAVQAQKPQAGERAGSVSCPRCGGGLKFTIQSTGISRGRCTCGISWCQ